MMQKNRFLVLIKFLFKRKLAKFMCTPGIYIPYLVFKRLIQKPP